MARIIRLVLLLMLTGSAVQAQVPMVKVITNNWTSQLVMSEVYIALLAQQGVASERVPSSVAEQWGALSYGVAHVQVEVWEGTMATDFARVVSFGEVLDMGSHLATTREDWWYPAYVAKQCPGLPDWRALKKCAAIFARDDSAQGVYVAGPWEKPDEARIRALGLNFKVHQLANGDDLWVALRQAHQQGRPIVLFNWSPNWVESRYEGAFVEFPPHDPACETDPGWGLSTEFLYDCGNPTGGWLKKAAWRGLQKQNPCAFGILQQLNFSTAQIAQAAAWVDVDGLSYAQAAQKWLQRHQPLWQSWLSKLSRECARD